MGRPPKGDEHPRKVMADQIGLLAALGVTNDNIAKLCNMSTATLHKHYQDDLDLGAAKACAVVGGKIYTLASRGEPWACTLFAKTRMGWSEKSVQEHTGPNGGPIQTEATLKADEAITALLDEHARIKAGLAKPD